MNLFEELAASRERLGTLRRDIHAHPELAFEEFRTADLVARHLESLGIETHRGIGGTGVVGVIRNGEGGMIALRADMDALPIQERNSFAHCSRNEGRMHACGHDGHTAMLLGAAELLIRHKPFAGTVVLVFQPAEEGEGGALAMIRDGLFERFPVDAIYGMHNWPGLAAGHFAVHDGPVMAGTDRFDIEILGHGAHAAMPHLGVDPVVVGAALVQALQTITSRTLDPLDSAVVSLTQFHAGEAYNVIPDRASLNGTARAFSADVQSRIEDSMQRICAGIAAAHGANIHFNYRRGYPPTINTAAEAALSQRAAGKVVGAGGVETQRQPSMGAEDFSFYLQEKPGCYVWIGNGPGEGGCTLHNPLYDFNDQIIPAGVSYWVELTRTCLPPGLMAARRRSVPG